MTSNSDATIWGAKDITGISIIDTLSSIGDVLVDNHEYDRLKGTGRIIDFSLKSILFEHHNAELFGRIHEMAQHKDHGNFLDLGYRKIVWIGYNTSCCYAFHAGNQYKDKTHSIVLINNRRFTEKNYEKTKRRVMRGMEYLEDNRIWFDKSMVQKMLDDVETGTLDSQQFKELLKNEKQNPQKMKDNEKIIHDYIMLTLRKQYDKIPSQCAVPTTIYNDITLSIEEMIEHNMKDSYTQYVKNINNEKEAMIEHCNTNMEKYQYVKKLKESSPESLLKVHWYPSMKMLDDPMIVSQIIGNLNQSLGK